MHTLDGSKDVQGARREPKGRLGQNVLAAGLPRFVLGINSKLIEINSNRRLSRTVRNLASSNIIVNVLWIDGYEEHGITTPAMVIIVMLLNDIPHVWHRLVLI